MIKLLIEACQIGIFLFVWVGKISLSDFNNFTNFAVFPNEKFG